MKRLALPTALAIALVACGAGPAPTREPKATEASAPRPASTPFAARSGAGSSDGTTCEEARDANVEELGMGEKGPADLTATELGKVLNHGQYLGECGVPNDTGVSICAAIKGGVVKGVTVSMTPASEELEKCVAKAVRALPFPSHPKMDIVRTQF